MEPFYWPEDFERPILLYAGPLQLPIGVDVLDGTGQIALYWRPGVDVRWTFDVAEVPPVSVGRLLARDLGVQPVPLALEGEIPRSTVEPWSRTADGTNVGTAETISYRASERFSSSVGDPTRLSVIVLHIVNFTADHRRSDLTFETDGWNVVIQRPTQAATQIERLRSLGGFGFTDTVTIQRIDGALFDYAETKAVQDALFQRAVLHKGSSRRACSSGWV